jgi:hypothetical protein
VQPRWTSSGGETPPATASANSRRMVAAAAASSAAADGGSLPTADGRVRQLLGRPGELWGAESAVDKLVVARSSA